MVNQKINIKVETNIEGEKPFELTYDKIFNPIESGVSESNKDLDYPYFSPDVKYSPEVLMAYMKQDYGKVVRAFFDINIFSEMINESKKQNENANVNENSNDIIKNNIYLTLLFLFPMRYPQSANVKSSYDKYICKRKTNEYQKYFPSSNTISSALFGKVYDIEKEVIREYSYINTSKGVATVTEIVWLNDVLNNPIYRKLIDKLIQYDNWLDDKKKTIADEIINAEIDLITNMKTPELMFTESDVKKIEDQKNISYSKNDLTNDIVNVIKKYIVLVEKDKDDNRKKCINDLLNKLFIINENNKIKKLVDAEQNKIVVDSIFDGIKGILFDLNFTEKKQRHIRDGAKHVIFDFLKYEGVKGSYIELRNKNGNDFNEITISKNITGKNATIKDYVLKNLNGCNIIENTYDVYEKLKNNADFESMLENMKSDITVHIVNYNRNYSNISNISKYSSIQLVTSDINIDKAVKEMNNILGILKEIKDEQIVFNDKNTESLNTIFKKIMNSVDSLKTFFSESSIRENRITGVSSIQIKLEKILKKSNDIKALQLVEQYLFSDITKGIYLYYEDEKTESANVLKTELKKEKYSFFTNTVKYIKENFVNIESTNDELNKLMRYYFENTGNKFITDVVDKAKDTINTNKVTCNELMNVGVTKLTTNKEDIPIYEINIYMEVVIGKLDYQTQNNIKCEYRDAKLLAYFDKFTTNPNKFELIKKKAIQLKQNDAEKNTKNKRTNGGKTRRKKHYLQNNKRYTSKRR